METNIIFSEVQLKRLALHRVGNKSRDEGIRIAQKLLPLNDEEMTRTLLDYFLGSFKLDEFYQFNHPNDLAMNEVYNFCSYIFENPEPEVIYEQSVNILRHLYDCSNHSKIADGELYVGYFEDIIVDDELVTAVGIFKAETKERYLKLRLDEDEDWELYFEEGTDITKLDKGCLVFNTQKEEGYRAISVDLKSSDAKYWRDDFLMLTQLHDDNFYTKTYMNLCKQFGKSQYETEEKQEQVNFLNKSLDYFNGKEEFDFDDFAEEIFEENEEKKESFKQYKEEYQIQQGLLPEEEQFFISAPVVKKTERSFRKVIQLDTQMEIKIHSSSVQEDGVLERGFDEEKGMHYYKIYFNDEK